MTESRRQTRVPAGIGRRGGFTLIELMVAVAILGIIIGIAIPSYQRYVLESGRADGKAALFGAAQTLERCYTRYSSYSDDACAIGDGDTIDSEEGKYEVAVSIDSATAFTLTASPTGAQAKDKECPQLTLDHTGARGVKEDSGDDVIDECW